MAIITIPIITPRIETWYPSFWQDRGRSSSKLINTMMPATKAREKDKTAVLRKGININTAMTAPAGSLNPDRKEYQNAFGYQSILSQIKTLCNLFVTEG